VIGPLSGYLLASPDESPIRRQSLVSTHSTSSKAPYLQFVETFERTRFWERYAFLSDRTFEDLRVDQRPPYRFDVFCARSGSKLIVLTEKKKLTQYLIERVLNETIFPNLKHVSFQMGQIISAFQSPDSDYRITALHGKFSGPDRHLRTAIFYGTEVTASTVFQTQRHLFNFYRCGITERSVQSPFDSADDVEIAHVGEDGSITVKSFHRQKALELNRVVNHLIINKWVDNWVAPFTGVMDDVDEG
jgi:hypothetical protein